MNKQYLIDFTKEIAALFEAGEIRAPIHLSGGAEQSLIDIFKDVRDEDYVFGTHRSMLHALLKGVPSWWVREEILKGRSICLTFPDYNFYTSATVGGNLPIALGVAMGIERCGGTNRVWCFLGDMARQSGIMHECQQYAAAFDLPITFVAEDNGFSVNTPTATVWGQRLTPAASKVISFQYERTYPHAGSGTFVEFG